MALSEVALAGGNARLAAKRLGERGVQISPATLTSWCNRSHPEVYAEVQ